LSNFPFGIPTPDTEISDMDIVNTCRYAVTTGCAAVKS